MRGLTRKAGKARNPLEPLASLNWLVLCLLGPGLVWGVVSTVFWNDGFLGWGHTVICATSDNTGETVTGSSVWQTHAGVSWSSRTVQLCLEKPTAGQRWLSSLDQLPGAVTPLAVVLVVFLLLRHAERFGLYSSGIAARLRILGWFLVAESLIGPAFEVFASRTLWHTMTSGPSEIQWMPGWTALFAGLALLSLARIMRVGSTMREDLEGVV